MRLLLESVKDYAICALDTAGRVTSWNDGARRLLGYTAEEIAGQTLHRFYLPEDLRAGKPDTELQTALATGRSEDEGWRVHRDGSRFWANEIVTPLRAGDGTHMGFAKVSRDLSEHKQAQEALHASEERQRLILESIHDHAIFTQDEAGRIVEWNSGAEQVFGYTAEEAIGQPSAMVFTPEDRARGAHVQEMQQARSTGRAADERWHVRKGGTRFFASGVLTPLRAGAAGGYVKVARDLTERRQMEERLEAQVRERTVQVRELVTQLTMTEQEERRRISGLLHDDLQQRLFSLRFQLASLRQALAGAETAAAQQIIGEMEQALHRSVHITRELSVDLSPPVLHDEGLAAALQWLASQIHQQQGLEVLVEAEPGIPLLSEDLRVLLFHTVRELLFNIVKHAGVDTAKVTVGGTGTQLRIEVSDAGRGFAPGSSEAAPTSQGLRRVEQRMQLLGGAMEIASAPGQGTRATLSVPLYAQGWKQA
jgi:PAS domain S-box-containing protein